MRETYPAQEGRSIYATGLRQLFRLITTKYFLWSFEVEDGYICVILSTVPSALLGAKSNTYCAFADITFVVTAWQT